MSASLIFLRNVYLCSMKNKEAIRRKKLYYDGLEKAIANIPYTGMEDFLQDPDVDDAEKRTLRIWAEVAGPLHNAIAFIINNRMISEDLSYLIERDRGKCPLMMPGEIFDTLKSLILPTIIDFLSVLSTTSLVKEKLVAMVDNNDKEEFVTMLNETSCDTSDLSTLCHNCLEATPSETAFAEEDLPYLLDIVETASIKENEQERMSRVARQWQTSTQQLLEDDNDENYERYCKDYAAFIQSQLRNSLFMYWEGYDDLVLKERQIIERILSNPLVTQLVTRYKEEYKAMKMGVHPFFLPNDFFHSKCAADDSEHLHIKLSIEDKGAELFAEFINYVAEKGYIEDSPAMKNLFAYRLTGYYRPEGELPTIVWNGRNGKSYELIYLIRYLCDRGDYKKMRRFFEGPEWVKEKDSSYAHSADTEFRRRMSEFYPEICEFRK